MMVIDTIYHSSLFYKLWLMYKKKYSEVESYLNRLITYFHDINFL